MASYSQKIRISPGQCVHVKEVQDGLELFPSRRVYACIRLALRPSTLIKVVVETKKSAAFIQLSTRYFY